jgi:hypothetical protein
MKIPMSLAPRSMINKAAVKDWKEAKVWSVAAVRRRHQHIAARNHAGTS